MTRCSKSRVFEGDTFNWGCGQTTSFVLRLHSSNRSPTGGKSGRLDVTDRFEVANGQRPWDVEGVV